MDGNSIITFLACIIFLFLFGRIFILPLKNIFKLILNSVLGGVLIYIINLIGGAWGFSIGLNFFTSIFVGILGIPGAILLIILQLIIQRKTRLQLKPGLNGGSEDLLKRNQRSVFLVNSYDILQFDQKPFAIVD